MSDDIELPDGTYAPIQDTVCECCHWYDEHDDGSACAAPGCECHLFVADPAASTAHAVAARGGDPDYWPDHVHEALRRQQDEAVGRALRPIHPILLGVVACALVEHQRYRTWPEWGTPLERALRDLSNVPKGGARAV